MMYIWTSSQLHYTFPMTLFPAGFFITEPVSNNRLDYAVRKDPKIYVPNLIEGILEDVQIWEYIAIETIVNDVIQSEAWLRHFIFLKNARVPTWISDNHNHAFTFWHDALQKWFIQPGSLLVHIDQHTDLSTPIAFPSWDHPQDATDKMVADYTNTDLTIADFIVPALSSGLLWDALIITGEDITGSGIFSWKNQELHKDDASDILQNMVKYPSIVVDLDLDYFSQGFDENVLREVVKYWFAKADIITVATSPLFIKQEKALEVLKSLQKELLLL